MDRSASKPVPDDSHSISMEPPSGRRSGRRNGTAQARVSAKVEVEGGGIHVERRFTHQGVHPFDEVTWETRTAAIGNEKGETVFEQKDCEIPTFWSQMATNVVVSKYFRGKLGTPGRETSVKQMIARVAETIGKWGREGGYFATETDAQAFQDELTHLVLHQKMSFNSPVWFNVGVATSKPQTSACFINSVEDTMESILTLAKTEGMLFKYGSGTGTNLSTIRSATESLAGGGTASGPVSFMKGFDAFAGVIKSGGTTRRAAKMVILNADHPDVEEFITCKVSEERKAWALIEAGYDSSFTGEAYASVFFQNSNNSVRVTDEFMRAVQDDRDWHLRAVTDSNRILKTVKARDLMRLIAESAWQCGDPGMQYDTTINDWHTSANTGRINASNPCSEYMFLDDTSCNLASINLTRFLNDDGSIDIEAYKHAIHITITAQEILVSNASYPTEKIARNSEEFRPLGLGYANLGALLMARGVPYDSPRVATSPPASPRSSPARRTRSPRASPVRSVRSAATPPTASRCCGWSASIARPRTTSPPTTSSPISSVPPGMRGTRHTSSVRGTDIATRRRRCSLRPERSASCSTATPPASSRTSRSSSTRSSSAAAC